MTAEEQAKLAIYRAKSIRGEISEMELMEAVRIMREGRTAAQASATTSRPKKAAGPVINGNDLLDEMLG